MMRTIENTVKYIRSKNAGPFWLTIDAFCNSVEDTENVAAAFEQEKDRRKTPSGQNRTPSAQQPSKFRNFEERSYNMDELTKKLLRSN